MIVLLTIAYLMAAVGHTIAAIDAKPWRQFIPTFLVSVVCLPLFVGSLIYEYGE